MTKKSFEHWAVWSGVFEIFTIGGIFYGWPAFVFVLKEEEVFYELCNSTSPTNQTAEIPESEVIKSCNEQDIYFNMLFVIGCSISNMLGIVFGYVMDTFGLFTCRLMTSTPLTLGLILMVFYEHRKSFVLGVELLALSAIGTLLTNLTLQPIWPERTSTIGSIFSGTFDGSSATFMVVKVIHDYGISLRSILICLAAWSSFHWLRTFAAMPKTVIPRDLPESFDLRQETAIGACFASAPKSDSSKLKKLAKEDESLVKNVADFEVCSEVCSTPPKASIFFALLREIVSVKFSALALWYCLVSLRINSFQFWFNPSLQWMFPDQKSVQSELTNIFGLTYVMSLPLSPVAGAVVDRFAKKYRKGNLERKGRHFGVAFICTICSLLGGIVSSLSVVRHNYAVAVLNQFIFSTVRTFLYAILAQAAFLLFPHELFGSVYGLLNLLNGIVTFAADPLFRLVHSYFEGDYSTVHYVLTVSTLFSLIYPAYLVRQGRLI